jgi:hypothetical protein
MLDGGCQGHAHPGGHGTRLVAGRRPARPEAAIADGLYHAGREVRAEAVARQAAEGGGVILELPEERSRFRRPAEQAQHRLALAGAQLAIDVGRQQLVVAVG